jgi:hypothetical protein
MRKSLRVFVFAAVAGPAILLCACTSGGGSFAAPSSENSSLSRSGLANVQAIRRPPAGARPSAHQRKLGPKYLYVSDLGANAVEIFANAGFTNAGNITESIDGPDGSWVDKNGNLYVANYKGVNISEYAPGASTPTFTYASGMSDPVNVTTDAQGNVYEADYAGNYVNEYNQDTDAVVATCSLGGAVEGVAVDGAGDVFVDYYTGSVGAFTEFVGGLGLSGCVGTTLGVTIGFPGGMVLDKNGALVVCDQTAPALYVIKPPYGSVKFHLGTGWKQPFHVTYSRALKEAFVADVATASVQVLKYPSGINVTTLNSANGLALPMSAVDGENFVP